MITRINCLKFAERYIIVQIIFLNPYFESLWKRNKAKRILKFIYLTFAASVVNSLSKKPCLFLGAVSTHTVTTICCCLLLLTWRTSHYYLLTQKIGEIYYFGKIATFFNTLDNAIAMYKNRANREMFGNSKSFNFLLHFFNHFFLQWIF